jgi:hypothetical protein
VNSREPAGFAGLAPSERESGFARRPKVKIQDSIHMLKGTSMNDRSSIENIHLHRGKRTRRQRSLLALVFALVLVAMPAGTFAQLPIQLDGNAQKGSCLPFVTCPAGTTDWDEINNGVSIPEMITSTGLVGDRGEPTTGYSQFSGGGSKDEQDITNWRHRSGTPPSKDDLSHAFAAAFNHNGQFILTFGMDRYDTSGDAQLGFWFLKQNIQPQSNGTFSGKHADGDLLVLVNFSGGGDIPTIQVFKWQGTGLIPADTAQAVKCIDGDIPAGKNFCGITNVATEPAPWPYENKNTGLNSPFPPAAFFEGAINLSLEGLDGCFTGFLAESRSSTSITATLKDFAIPGGGFNVCGIKVTKACGTGAVNATQDGITYPISGKITNSGFGKLYDITLVDSPALPTAFQRVKCDANDPATPGAFPLAELAGGEVACYTNTMTVALLDNGKNDTVTVSANTEDNNPNSALTAQATADCQDVSVSPELTVSKRCATSLALSNSRVVVKVTVDVEVCNTGDSKLLNVSVKDVGITTDPDPLINNITLEKGACATKTGTYFPSAALTQIGQATTVPDLAVFKDTVQATAKDIFGNAVSPLPVSAECKLCQ